MDFPHKGPVTLTPQIFPCHDVTIHLYIFCCHGDRVPLRVFMSIIILSQSDYVILFDQVKSHKLIRLLLRIKTHNDVGWASTVTGDGWSSSSHLLLQHRRIIVRMLSLDKHINGIRLVSIVSSYPAFTWFYMKNEIISSYLRKKLVGHLIYDCPFWYGC